MTEELSARIDLLDNQLVDADELPVGRVDDIELEVADDGSPPKVIALLTGSQALGERLGGAIGAAMAAVSARLRRAGAPQGPTRLDPRLLTQLEPMLKLRVPLSELEDLAGLERWLASKVIGRVPGGGDADL